MYYVVLIFCNSLIYHLSVCPSCLYFYLLADHPRSGTAYNLSLFLSAEVHIRTSGIYRGNTSQVCIWTSSGQGQGHRSNKGGKSIFPECKTSIRNNSGSI